MMMRATWVVVLAAAAAVLGACDKKQNGTAAAPDKPDKAATDPATPPSTPPPVDPWAGPSAGGSTFGNETGAKLKKVDAKPAKIESNAKVDPSTIAKPAAKKTELKTLNGSGATGFTVTYNRSDNAAHEEYRKVFQEQKIFEQVAANLNNTIRIPHTIEIQTVDCGVINAFYDPNSDRIIVCYELLDYFLQVFKPTAKNDTQLGNAVMGALMFTFYHETGHGLIHLLDLPAVGREEDSVDQLATLTLISMGDAGVEMAESGAYWFQLQSKKGNHTTPFWDEHGFDGQRFYNIMCLIYGSNPDKYKAFTKNGDLPVERARRCAEEYVKIDKAWNRLLEPHLTNGAAVNLDYKPTVPTNEAPKTTKKDPWGDSPSGDSTPTIDSKPPEPEPEHDHGITCEDVADKAAVLIRKDAESHAQNMTDDERDELDRRLHAQLPAAKQQILKECAKANWGDKARQCVMDAKTLEQATKCQ
jgi:hypothetical protein